MKLLYLLIVNSSSNPHGEAWSGFAITAYDYKKVVPKAACDPENCYQKSTNERERKPEPKLMRLLEQSLEVAQVSVFKEARRNLIFIILLTRQSINLIPFSHVQKVLF
jgi:hypothetical protein